MRIVFHIGTDKTGSTAIQQHLMLNRDWFHARSVYIPEIGLGRSNGHSALFRNFSREQLELLRNEIDGAARAGFSAILLSWEGMNFFSTKQIHGLREAVANHDPMVLVYLREQADLIQSGILQQLKSISNKASIRLFESPGFGIEMLRSHRLKYPPNRNYYRLLRRWQQGLAGAECSVRLFDREQLIEGDIVDDFLAQLGLAADDEFMRKQDTANISLDVESGILVDRWQCTGLPQRDLLRLIDVATSNIACNGPGNKYFLSEKTVAKIRRHYRDSNRKVARDFLGKSGALFPAGKSCWRDRPLADIVRRADVLAGEIAKIDETPTLSNHGAGKSALEHIDFGEGWHQRERWGAWSSGSRSRIRFRIWRRRIGPGCTGIRLLIQGRYAGDNNPTRVWVNDIDFGDVSLTKSCPGLALPLTALLPYETVEVTLRHSDPVTPGKSAGNPSRQLIAFGLERINYQYLQSPVGAHTDSVDIVG